MELVAEGTVIIIGGAEDKVRDRVILSRFVALAGGRDARIAVIATASSFGMEAGDRYRTVFTELGAAEVVPLNAVTRAQANDEQGRSRWQESSHGSSVASAPGAAMVNVSARPEIPPSSALRE